VSESKAGTYGWALLGIGVLAWDILAPETLSSAADRALEHPVGKYVALGATALVGAHVVNLFDNYDIPDPILLANDVAQNVSNNLRERLGHGSIKKHGV
jgi:hypothetical protein